MKHMQNHYFSTYGESAGKLPAHPRSDSWMGILFGYTSLTKWIFCETL
ncbi:hypothetical protein LOS22_07425 [Enterococcus faecium]|nr:hypothetical protein [Enterococcus faecium]